MYNSKTILILFFACLSALPSIAQKQVPSQRLDEMILDGMEDWQIPGLAALVVKDGEVVFKKTYGVKSIHSMEAVDGNTLFNMGSTTKAIIAISIGMLVDQGKLNWEDKVIQHLPGFRLSDAYITADARVKDLLTHNLGIGNADLLWGIDSLSTAETVKRFQYAEKTYPLRGGFVYQNILYAVAGQLIESASGQHWTLFVEENIFKPLKMSRSRAKSRDILGAGNYTTPHLDDLDDRIVTVGYNFSDQIGAAGMIWSSINDISNYMTFLINDGVYQGDTLLHPSTFQYLFKPHALMSGPIYPTSVLTQHNWNTYGLGWFQQDYRGHKLDFHTGSIDGLVAIAAVLHSQNTGVYVFANLDHAELRHAIMYKALDLFAFNDDTRDWNKEVFELYAGFRQQAIDSRVKRDSSRILDTTPTLPIENFAGIYKNQMGGNLIVKVIDNELHINMNNFLSLSARHWHYNTFITNKESDNRYELMMNFNLDHSGKVNDVELMGLQFLKTE